MNLIRRFSEHRVAGNLLMMLMLLAGAWGLSKLNTQFFPTFELDVVQVRVVWTGATAEDVETSITVPIEQQLRAVDDVKKMTSTSSNGIGVISLE
ncbi:MAG: efflux RND transporter permease subunit, partial [Gammaproteobacteria bacterium]|nr:efflux RND transporter permease subunit [Gammaproteobacteria bacterium]